MTEAEGGNDGADRIRALLDSAEARNKPIRFWWRDDDAVTATPEFEQLLALRARFDVPLALAVIPAHATPTLAARLAGESRVAVLQHGWAHESHAAPGEKNIELDGHRPLANVLDELKRGFERLLALIPERFLPVLVPPWNRIADKVGDARREAGLVGLSTFGRAPNEPHRANTHIDVLAWHPTRPKPRAELLAALADEIEQRLGGSAEPIGILTHHLVHEDESWAAIEEILGMLAKYPGAAWPSTEELFGLEGWPVISPRGA